VILGQKKPKPTSPRRVKVKEKENLEKKLEFQIDLAL